MCRGIPLPKLLYSFFFNFTFSARCLKERSIQVYFYVILFMLFCYMLFYVMLCYVMLCYVMCSTGMCSNNMCSKCMCSTGMCSNSMLFTFSTQCREGRCIPSLIFLLYIYFLLYFPNAVPRGAVRFNFIVFFFFLFLKIDFTFSTQCQEGRCISSLSSTMCGPLPVSFFGPLVVVLSLSCVCVCVCVCVCCECMRTHVYTVSVIGIIVEMM